MSDDWQQVTPPVRTLPRGACDTHAHVFGPYADFPLAADRSYTPPEADADEYDAVLRTLGFDRAVLVHPSAYGADHAVTLAAIARDPANRCGVATVRGDAPDDLLAGLVAGGMRALRFTEMKKNGRTMAGAIGFAELDRLAPRLAGHGLHVQVFAALADIIDNIDRLLAAGVPVVLDHMGRYGPPAPGPDDPNFRRLLDLVRDGQVWVKLTAFRNSTTAPDYPDVRPYHDALIAAAPERMLWGSDWPVLSYDPRLDVGQLLRLFDDWIGNDPALRQQILVDNPAALFDF